jgi:type VI secretion system protein ImpA
MMDLEKLLTPIRDDAPSGDDLRDVAGDLTMENLGELRRAVDPALGGEGQEPNWTAVRRECEAALEARSKDLQLAAHLTEALAHLEGFAGVRAGLELTRELVERFWDGLHPGAESGGTVDQPYRARWLNWMGGSRDFIGAVSQCPVVDTPGSPPLSWRDYRNSELVDEKKVHSDPTQYREMIAAGYINGEQWLARVKGTEPERLREVLEAVRGCESVTHELELACEKRFVADELPSLTGLKSLFGDLRGYLEERLPTAEPTSEQPQSAATGAGAAVPVAASAAPAGPVASRDEALRRLGEVAEFFRRTEPHSPISYLVQRAVRWGHMPLEGLLKEVVKNDDVLSRIWETLGLDSAGGAPKADE